ncbi:hypothetical protein D9M71_557520 [compost metagenome]
MPVDAVQGHQMRIVEAADQPAQQGLFDVLAGRGDRQEMRLVRHHQVLIDVQDGLFDRDRLFVWHFAKIMDAQTRTVGKRGADRRALSVQHPAAGDAIEPLLAADGLEVLAQAIDYRHPVAGRQAHGAGLMLSRIEGRRGHGNTLDRWTGHYPPCSPAQPASAAAASVNSLSQRSTSTASQRLGS